MVEVDWNDIGNLTVLEQRQSGSTESFTTRPPGAVETPNESLPKDAPVALQSMKVVELRKLAKVRGLRTSGKKAELIERLLG